MYTADYARKKVSGVVLTNIKNKLSEYGLYLEKRNDEFLFTISIVDVAEQVGPNSPGFDRAWEMIESHFIKGEFQTLVARPLLEEKIILQENKDRPTISVAFKIKKNGDYQCLGIKSTVFRSRKRFHFLKGDQILKNMPKDLDGAFFMALEELALILRAKRLEKLQIPDFRTLSVHSNGKTRKTTSTSKGYKEEIDQFFESFLKDPMPQKYLKEYINVHDFLFKIFEQMNKNNEIN